MLRHGLVGMGLRQGAVQVVVGHSTGPSGFAYLSFRNPLAQEFARGGEIELAWPSGHALGRPEQLLAAVQAATGIPAEPDQTEHRSEEESPWPTTAKDPPYRSRC
jgi:hypothetical protein